MKHSHTSRNTPVMKSSARAMCVPMVIWTARSLWEQKPSSTQKTLNFTATSPRSSRPQVVRSALPTHPSIPRCRFVGMSPTAMSHPVITQRSLHETCILGLSCLPASPPTIRSIPPTRRCGHSTLPSPAKFVRFRCYKVRFGTL